MIRELHDRLRQTKPFANNEEEVALALQVIAEDHRAVMDSVFKSSDLTATQYNVLRILRGAGNDGLCCREIAERMITRDPDITRMLDRLELRELITRERLATDRRVILAFITKPGLALLKKLDGPITDAQRSLFDGLSQKDLEALSRTLAKLLRGGTTVSCEGGKQ